VCTSHEGRQGKPRLVCREQLQLPAPADDTSAEGKALVKACLLNLASCGLKLQRHADVVQYTSDVLASEPNNVKALYRRGQVILVADEPVRCC
jgi:hypothetical protein